MAQLFRTAALPIAALGLFTAWGVFITGAESVQLVRMCQANSPDPASCELRAYGR